MRMQSLRAYAFVYAPIVADLTAMYQALVRNDDCCILTGSFDAPSIRVPEVRTLFIALGTVEWPRTTRCARMQSTKVVQSPVSLPHATLLILHAAELCYPPMHPLAVLWV